MNGEPTNVEKLRGLPWSIAANSANTVFVQFTFFGSVFVLFLGQLGLSKTQIGLLLSIFPFTGLIALFVAPAVSRYGYKRIYLFFFGAGKIVTALLLFTPLIQANFGANATLAFVATVVIFFAVLRAIAETANFPWIQEYVPNSMRGKYSATNNVFTTVVGLPSVTVAGVVIGRSSGLTGFMILIAVGVAAGLISVAAASRVPGGNPRPKEGRSRQRDLKDALGDGGFLLYVVGASLIILATTPVASFLPLCLNLRRVWPSPTPTWTQ